MVRLVILVFWFCAVATAAGNEVFQRQLGDACTAISTILGKLDCSDSTTECIEGTTEVGTIDAIRQLICRPDKITRENIYDTLVSCQGQASADLIYAGICGSTTIAGNEVLCTDAILTVNNGISAKEACCGPGNASQCASELQQLSSDLGCCTATIVFQLYLQECEDGQGLAALFQANGVIPPPLCDYPLYEPGSGDDDGSGSFRVAASVAAVSIGVVIVYSNF